MEALKTNVDVQYVFVSHLSAEPAAILLPSEDQEHLSKFWTKRKDGTDCIWKKTKQKNKNKKRVMLPFQSCEHCPGKSSHISLWVQTVAHPKSVLHGDTKRCQEKDSAIHRHRNESNKSQPYPCCPWSLTEGTIPQSSDWAQLLSRRGRACCRSAYSAAGPTPVRHKQLLTRLSHEDVSSSICTELELRWHLNIYSSTPPAALNIMIKSVIICITFCVECSVKVIEAVLYKLQEGCSIREELVGGDYRANNHHFLFLSEEQSVSSTRLWFCVQKTNTTHTGYVPITHFKFN